jgi:hypothetical protein
MVALAALVAALVHLVLVHLMVQVVLERQVQYKATRVVMELKLQAVTLQVVVVVEQALLALMLVLLLVVMVALV